MEKCSEFRSDVYKWKNSFGDEVRMCQFHTVWTLAEHGTGREIFFSFSIGRVKFEYDSDKNVVKNQPLPVGTMV